MQYYTSYFTIQFVRPFTIWPLPMNDVSKNEELRKSNNSGFGFFYKLLQNIHFNIVFQNNKNLIGIMHNFYCFETTIIILVCYIYAIGLFKRVMNVLFSFVDTQ